MKPLFKKDIRENFRLALIGFAILTLIIGLQLHSGADLLHRISLGKTSGQIDALQPLLSGGLLAAITFFCAIFGVALGWFQTRNESHRDLWAFLIHRPVTRTGIFWGKTSAGLALYCAGAGLPLLGLIAYAAMPGNIAAPFEWAMVLPAFNIFLTGIAYYFAGMLTGLRQARWFGSRTFGLAIAIAASVAAGEIEVFWQALVAIVLLTLTIATAAWGAYQTGGFYRGQPRTARFALTLSLTCGSILVLGLAVALLGVFLSRDNDYSWQNYQMTRDGKIHILTAHEGREIVADLDGKPTLDPETGEPITQQKFRQQVANSLSTTANHNRKNWWQDSYNSAARFFTLWRVSSKTLWYLDRHGKLIGFSGVTRQHVGNIVAQNASGDDAFIPAEMWGGNNYFNSYDSHYVLSTSSTVYRVNLDDHNLVPLFAAKPGDPIIGCAQNGNSMNILVLTRATVWVLDASGHPVASVPYLPGFATHPQVQLSSLKGTNHFAIWFLPDYLLNAEAHWKMPEHIVWLGDEDKISRTLTLPTLHTDTDETTFEKIATCLIPPAFQCFVVISSHSLTWENWLCVLPSVICVLIGLTLVRRYHFSTGAAIGWMLFIILLGIPALMAFLFAQEWPKRESCPNCHKLRVVDNDHCEHCAAAFPPPNKTGIEIFEPLVATP